MRTVRSLAAIGLVLPSTVLLGGPAAAAAEPEAISLVVDRSAWSWRSQTAALPAREPSLVPAGRHAVAWDGQPGVAAKATYLHLDVPALPAGATVDGLTLALPLDPAADQVDPGGIRLVACRLLADFPAGEAADPATMPEEDCTDAPVGEYDEAAGTWSFPVTGLGRSWLADPAANHGVVVRPAPDYAVPTDLPFQLVFAGASEISARLLTSLPAAPPAAPAEPAERVPPALDLGAGFAAPPTGGETVLPPLVTAPVPQAAGPAPVTAPVTAGPPAALPSVPSTQLAAARTSPGAVAVLAGAVAVLLLAVARVVGNTAGPAAFARAERAGLDRIRLRAPLATGALVAAPPVAALPAQVPQRRQGRRPISSATSTVT